MNLPSRFAAGVFVLLSGTAAPAQQLVSDRVLILMRHGVRPPTKAQPMAPGIAADPWPAWTVPPGHLTERGARNIELLGKLDRKWLQAKGLLPRSGCPAAGAVSVIADSDQRTIKTAERWAAALMPGCPAAIEHKPQDVPDPLFSPLEVHGTRGLDPVRATEAVRGALAGQTISEIEALHRPLLARIDRVLCGRKAKTCGVSGKTSSIDVAAGRKVKISGALDEASTAGQILLLEYADGKPMHEVGWGRASAADIRDFSAFHALEYRIVGRPRYLAAANVAALLPTMRRFLMDQTGEQRVLMISGHDTQVASLGGLLDAHWQAPGAAADDPVPGGGIVIEALHDSRGRRYVRAYYRAQGLLQMRTLSAPTLSAFSKPFALPGCSAVGTRGLCTEQQFLRLLGS